MSVNQLSQDQFTAEVLESKLPVLLDFGAQWCGPCHLIAPILQEIAQERTDIKVCQVDVDEAPELAAEFQISAIPSIYLLEQGKVKNMVVGLQTKDALLAMIDEEKTAFRET